MTFNKIGLLYISKLVASVVNVGDGDTFTLLIYLDISKNGTILFSGNGSSKFGVRNITFNFADRNGEPLTEL